MSMYFKRKWEEERGDGYSHWGFSVWYMETDEDGFIIRQIEKYNNGPTLRYGLGMLSDEYGELADQAIDLDDFAPFTILKEEFEAMWLL